MLLMKLKTPEKFAFLKLAHYVANIDGEFEREEQSVIEEYCAEMGIENIRPDFEKFNFEEILSQITTLKSQKIIILELMILVHSDDKFHRFEHEVIDRIAYFYNISKKDLDIFSQWGKTASALYTQGNLFIEN